MNQLLLIAGGSTLVYAVLAIVMGVLPGIPPRRRPTICLGSDSLEAPGTL